MRGDVAAEAVIDDIRGQNNNIPKALLSCPIALCWKNYPEENPVIPGLKSRFADVVKLRLLHSDPNPTMRDKKDWALTIPGKKCEPIITDLDQKEKIWIRFSVKETRLLSGWKSQWVSIVLATTDKPPFFECHLEEPPFIATPIGERLKDFVAMPMAFFLGYLDRARKLNDKRKQVKTKRREPSAE